MDDCREQRAAVKFCFLSGKSTAETIVILKTTYGDAALSKTRVYEWFSRFNDEEMSIEDQPRSRCHATSRSDENVDKINAVIREDHRRTIDQLCEMSGISWSSIHRILSEDLHMGRVAAKFVPHLLTGEQRERRLQACFELQNQLKGHDTNCPPPPRTHRTWPLVISFCSPDWKGTWKESVLVVWRR